MKNEWAITATVPPEPGSVNIPPNHVRLFHYINEVSESSDEGRHQAAMMLKEGGIDISRAKGSTYGEPNVVWASRQIPSRMKVFAEFSIAKDDERWAYSWRGGNVAENGDCYFHGSIRPDEILAVHEPWHNQYRYLVENGMLEECKAGNYDHLLDTDEYGPAVLKAKGSIQPTEPNPTPIQAWVLKNCRFAQTDER